MAGSGPVPVRETLRLPAVWLGALAFMLYVAIEISAGLWAFLLLTEGRGLSATTAGLCVSGYRDAGQCSALEGRGEGPHGRGRQAPSVPLTVVKSGRAPAITKLEPAAPDVAAGHAETENACGADVRPEHAPADRGEAGTHLGVARSARSAEGIPAIHGGGGSQWGSLFVGRVVQGVVAERLGVGRVLRGSLLGMTAGALLIAPPAPAWVAVAGLALVGFAAAPVYPLLTLATPERVGAAHADRAIGVQIGTAGLGAALIPGGLGVLFGHTSVALLGPALTVLAVLLLLLHALAGRRPGAATG